MKACLLLSFQTVLSVAKKRKRLKISAWNVLCSIARLRSSQVSVLVSMRLHIFLMLTHICISLKMFIFVSPFFLAGQTNFYRFIKLFTSLDIFVPNLSYILYRLFFKFMVFHLTCLHNFYCMKIFNSAKSMDFFPTYVSFSLNFEILSFLFCFFH